MRWKCVVAYDGTDFDGWQSQPGGRTIQDFIERRLAEIFSREVRIHGSGRTDAGVHARGQVFHFDADWVHGSEKLIRALRTGYPDTIQVSSVESVSDDFHSRFSVVKKRYTYRFHEGWADPFQTRYVYSLGNRRVSTDLMKEGAAQLLGEHDFSSFTANPQDGREDDPVRLLQRLDVERDGPEVWMTAEADGFLFRMVRSLAGCLQDVGTGRLAVAEVGKILEQKKRTNGVQTAPAQGLCLEQVWY